MTAAGAVLDAASLAAPPSPSTTPTPSSWSGPAICRCAAAGLRLNRDRDQAWRDFAGWRVNYDTALVSLASLVMAPYAPRSSDRSVTRFLLRVLPSRRNRLGRDGAR